MIIGNCAIPIFIRYVSTHAHHNYAINAMGKTTVPTNIDMHGQNSPKSNTNISMNCVYKDASMAHLAWVAIIGITIHLMT